MSPLDPKWTPGTWRALDVIPDLGKLIDNPAFVGQSAPVRIEARYIDAEGMHCTSFIATCDATRVDNLANAHLMAAAKEMYYALLYMVHGVIDVHVIENASAALAKARGEHVTRCR